MDDLRIKRAPRIEAEITVSGDKSISHRAVMIASLSNGLCVLRGFSPSADCMNTVEAMRALGIKIEQPEPDVLIVHGRTGGKLTAPNEAIDCGNSGTTMRLLAGMLAGQTILQPPGRRRFSFAPADGAHHRPAAHDGREHHGGRRRRRQRDRADSITGAPLHGINYITPVASAQLKSALLFAGLFAKGKTTVQRAGRRPEITPS